MKIRHILSAVALLVLVLVLVPVLVPLVCTPL